MYPSKNVISVSAYPPSREYYPLFAATLTTGRAFNDVVSRSPLLRLTLHSESITNVEGLKHDGPW